MVSAVTGANALIDDQKIRFRCWYRHSILDNIPTHQSGPNPNELYGRFTWKIENFSDISKRELRSDVFQVGNYKW